MRTLICKFVFVGTFLFGSLLLQPLAHGGDLVIDITRGVDNPTQIAIVPFQWKGAGFLPESVEKIVSNDLNSSGQFTSLPEGSMPLSLPRQQNDIVYSDWRKYGVEYIVIGRVELQSLNYRVVFELYNIHGQKQIFSKSATASNLRDLAHYVSDQVYEALTGFRGHFSTKIVYVRAVKDKGRDKFQLIYADQDGARAQEMLSSYEPLMSPTWSPNGQEIAYVSFENQRPRIFRQSVVTGARTRLTNFAGLNSAPAWSPDGTKLAMVLSKDDNPELYVMDLKTEQLTRLTHHYGIDTEPSWMPDSQSLVFTSSRGGQPQIYKVSLKDQQVERLTFTGTYNARGRVTPDGKYLVMVHRGESNGVFHIAAQDLKSGRVHILTDQTTQDESPSLAPNGRMLLYATREADGRGILSAVSLDGGVKVRLPSILGDVREPAWGPFLN